MRCMRRQHFLVPALVLLSGAASADGNKLYLLQSSPHQDGSYGNQIEIDQTNSLYSELGSDQEPLVQEGLANNAKITVEGYGSQIALSQTNKAKENTDGNTAEIMVYNGANASLTQNGIQNDAYINLDGQNLTGTMLQDGDRNTGRLLAYGTNATATMSQEGNDLTGELQAWALNSVVLYRMAGDGFTPAAPVRVLVFDRDVSITQTNVYANSNNGNSNGNNGNRGEGNNGNGNGNQ